MSGTVPDSVTVHAHAKVNLFLRVLARETTGYHTLETLFALLDLHDVLTVDRTAQGIELDVVGPDTGPADRNLAYRAAAAVLEATGGAFGVRVRLEKRIPLSAGLGGGSADGAAALHAVNALARNAVPAHEILHMAAKLGSDVPFLAARTPMAMAWGHGERLFRLAPPGAAPVLLLVPPFGINTAKAYQLLDDHQPAPPVRGPVVFDEGAFRSWGGIGRLGGNDFEVPVFGREPALRDLFERLCATRPLMARMSGSGSALFGIYKHERDRDAAAAECSSRDCALIATSTMDTPAAGARAAPV